MLESRGLLIIGLDDEASLIEGRCARRMGRRTSYRGSA